jgi:hypothetical protein
MYLDGYIPGDDGGTGPGNTAPGVSIASPANGDSFVSGTSINFSGLATDAEDGDLSSNLIWTSSLDGQIGTGGSFNSALLSVGTHTITAAVTDSGSLTGNTSVTIIVTPQFTFNLNVVTRIVKTNKYADLTWSGPASANVDVYRNGVFVIVTLNDGFYADKPAKTITSATYKVCLAGTTTCSNTITVTWPK